MWFNIALFVTLNLSSQILVNVGITRVQYNELGQNASTGNVTITIKPFKCYALKNSYIWVGTNLSTIEKTREDFPYSCKVGANDCILSLNNLPAKFPLYYSVSVDMANVCGETVDNSMALWMKGTALGNIVYNKLETQIGKYNLVRDSDSISIAIPATAITITILAIVMLALMKR